MENQIGDEQKPEEQIAKTEVEVVEELEVLQVAPTEEALPTESGGSGPKSTEELPKPGKPELETIKPPDESELEFTKPDSKTEITDSSPASGGPDGGKDSKDFTPEKTIPQKTRKEHGITDSMRKSFLESKMERLTQTADGKLEGASAGDCIPVMENMLHLLGKDKNYIRDFVDNLIYLARPPEGIFRSKKKRVARMESEIENLTDQLEGDFDSSPEKKEGEEEKKNSLSAEEREKYKKYILKNVATAVNSVEEFMGMVGADNCLNYDIIECVSNVELFRHKYPGDCDQELMDKLINSAQENIKDSLILDERLKIAEINAKEVQDVNNNTVETRFTMAGSTLGVGAAAVATIFPPALVLVAIIYLLYANENKYAKSMASTIEDKLNEMKNKLKGKRSESFRKMERDAGSEVTKKRSTVMKELVESIPDEMRPFIGKIIEGGKLADLTAVKKIEIDRKNEKTKGSTDGRSDKDGKDGKDGKDLDIEDTDNDRDPSPREDGENPEERGEDEENTREEGDELGGERKKNVKLKDEYDRLNNCTGEIVEKLLNKDQEKNL
ncbi:MAG: hypothetical protein LBU15_02165 [Rickettsiales bacterium]|jgi:hypothetical protein|nr:hypothetical protein [Rickettsiales bacterium]